MESFFARYRNLLALLAIVGVQLIGLAAQVRRSENGRNSLAGDASGVRLIRLWASFLVTPAERAVHATKLGVENAWFSYIDLHRVRRQNQELQQTIDRLRLEQAALLEDAKQGERLQKLLAFQQHYIYSTLAAQAIGSNGSEQSHVIYLDKGSADGLKPDMAVITGDGIVGKVRDVFPHTAQVLAINDQTSGAGVILETARIRGILRGDASGQVEIVGILADERIQPGERVLTAGGDLIFPRGLPVGVVQKVVRDPDSDGFVDVIVKPYAHLDQLDEVLVITSTEPQFSAGQKQDMAASESLKGAEAAALKDKAIQDQLKASQIMAERLPGLTDPNAPAASQGTGQAQKTGAATGGQAQGASASTEQTAPKLLQPQHLDRFSPGAAQQPAAAAKPDSQAVKPDSPTAKPNSNDRRNP
jgi:rod shape-determining protein MreC